MSPKEMEVVLKHYMSRLSPADLEELDSQLNGTEEPMASDSRLTPDQRKSFLAMDHKTRIAVRSARTSRAVQDGVEAQGFAERFPQAGRLR